MRDKLTVLLVVPALVLPLIIIAAGGDLDIVRREIDALRRVPFPIAVFAQNGSGPIDPSGEVMPSGPVMRIRWAAERRTLPGLVSV